MYYRNNFKLNMFIHIEFNIIQLYYLNYLLKILNIHYLNY